MRLSGVILCLAIGVFGCDDADESASDGDGGTPSDGGAGGGGGGGLAAFDESVAAETRAWASNHDAMLALARIDGFESVHIGDPATYQDSTETTPTQPGVLSSLYFETGGLRAALAATRDERPEVAEDGRAGERMAAAMVNALTIGFASGGTSGRGGPAWHARLGVRSLDGFHLLRIYDGLAERSTAGFDRALGHLWNAAGQPHGVGAIIAAADATCGTDYMGAIERTLTDVRAPFAAAIDEFGRPDPLDRLRFEAGDSPEYDAAILAVEEALTQGLATAMLSHLGDALDARAQAELLGAYGALSARVAASAPAADQSMTVTLDAADPGDVDREEARRILTEHLGVSPCGG